METSTRTAAAEALAEWADDLIDEHVDGKADHRQTLYRIATLLADAGDDDSAAYVLDTTDNL